MYMAIYYMKSGNSKTSDPHRPLAKYIALLNLRICYTWKNMKKRYKNNKFNISGAMWNDKFKLTDGSFSVSDIQKCFKYVIKNMK